MIDISNPQTSNLSCPTCTISFDSLPSHKEHYKSDFHRYNLKRKMVKLAPASQEQFKSKKTLITKEEVVEFKCNQCGKKYNSMQTLNQHIRTKGHNPNIIKQNQQVKKKAPEVYEKNEKRCLFCRQQAKSFSQNLKHMELHHSFFVPQKQYCKNEQGLIVYLQEKVQVGFMCIKCENKGAKDFNTGEAVRKHMLHKGHCFMKTEDGYEEYEKFYDFSEQFNAIVQDQKDRIVAGIQFEKIKVIVDESAEKQKIEEDDNDSDWQDASEDEDQQDDDEEWEDESGDEDEQDEQQIVQENQKAVKTKTKTYNIMKPTVTANEELLLPNGKILGHRKYRYLYRQNYRAPFWLQSQVKAIGSQAVSNALITKQRILDIIKKEKLLKNNKTRYNKNHLKVGMQNNLLMKYFRTQNSL